MVHDIEDLLQHFPVSDLELAISQGSLTPWNLETKIWVPCMLIASVASLVLSPFSRKARKYLYI